MTLKNYCEYIISASHGKGELTLQSLNAETLAESLLEAIETFERTTLVIDPLKYPLLLSRIHNWLDKVNKSR